MKIKHAVTLVLTSVYIYLSYITNLGGLLDNSEIRLDTFPKHFWLWMTVIGILWTLMYLFNYISTNWNKKLY